MMAVMQALAGRHFKERIFLEFITHFGSVTLLLPLAALLALVLWRDEGWIAACTYIVPLVGCLSTMLLLKLYFISCGTGRALDITSPSGHTATSTIVFGGIAVVMASHLQPGLRRVVTAGMTLLIGLIGISRVAVGAHTWEEVVLGLLVGASALVLFMVLYERCPKRPIKLKRLVIASAAIMALAYGVPSSAEQFIKQLSGQLRTQTNDCGASPRSNGVRI